MNPRMPIRRAGTDPIITHFAKRPAELLQRRTRSVDAHDNGKVLEETLAAYR